MLDSCLWDSILNRTKTCLYCVSRGWCQLAVLSPRKLTLGGSVSPLLALPDHASFDLCSIVGHLLVCVVAEKSLSKGPKMDFFTTVTFMSHWHTPSSHTNRPPVYVCARGSEMVEALREITSHFMAAFSQRDVTMHTQTLWVCPFPPGPEPHCNSYPFFTFSWKGLAVIVRSLWSKLVLIQIQWI